MPTPQRTSPRSTAPAATSSVGPNRVGVAMNAGINKREAKKHNIDVSGGSSMETLVITVPPPKKLVELLGQTINLP